MSVALDHNDSGGAALRLDWLPVLAALLVLYVPAFYSLAAWYWQCRQTGARCA